MTKFLILLSFLLTSLASAKNIQMTHEEFVHLSEKEKREYVVKIMELMVAMEAKYKKEVKTSGFDWNRYQRYTNSLKRLSEFFIPSAHAQRLRLGWAEVAQRFTKVMDNKDTCIYAGYISRMVNGKCTHPGQLERRSQHLRDQDTDPTERDAYEAGNNCPAPNSITCNPVIFGFKNQENGINRLFCVPAGVTHSENSSFKCMEKALTEDNKEKRMRDLVDNLNNKDNKPLAVQIHQYVAKSCICPNSTTTMDESYRSRISVHRTCYALLNMMNKTQCDSIIKETQIAALLVPIANNLTNNMSPEAFNTHYKSYRESVSTNSEEYRALCGGTPPVVTSPTEKSCTVSFATEGQNVTATARGVNAPETATFEFTAPEGLSFTNQQANSVTFAKPTEPKTINVKMKIGTTEEIVCKDNTYSPNSTPNNPPPNTSDITCVIRCESKAVEDEEGGDPQVNTGECEAPKFSSPTLPEGALTALQSGTLEPVGSPTLTFNTPIDFTVGGQPLKCTYQEKTDTSTTTETPKCSLALTEAEDKVNATATVEPSAADVSFEWQPADPGRTGQTASFPKSEKANIRATAKIGDKTIPCTQTETTPETPNPPTTDDLDYDVTGSDHSGNVKKFDVTLSVTKGSMDGYSVYWKINDQDSASTGTTLTVDKEATAITVCAGLKKEGETKECKSVTVPAFSNPAGRQFHQGQRWQLHNLGPTNQPTSSQEGLP